MATVYLHFWAFDRLFLKGKRWQYGAALILIVGGANGISDLGRGCFSYGRDHSSSALSQSSGLDSPRARDYGTSSGAPSAKSSFSA